MTSRAAKLTFLLATLVLAGGLGCASPSTANRFATARADHPYDPPPLYLKSGRRNPDAPPAL